MLRLYRNIACLFVLGGATASAQDNSWSGSTGTWATPANWSLGVVPSSTQSATLVTNAGMKTVTVDGTAPVGSLTISNLTVQSVSSATNTLFVGNLGGNTFHILTDLSVGPACVLVVTNGTLQVIRALTIEGVASMFDDGLLLATNILPASSRMVV